MYKIYIHKLWLIMRLTTVILIATFMQVSAAGFAQRITLNKKQAALEAVLKEIHNQSGYDFFFDRKLVDKMNPVSITVKNATLEETMKAVLADLPLVYNIDGKIIIIKTKPSSLLDKLGDYFDEIDVSGKVKDERGMPLAGAYIRSLTNPRMYAVSGKDGEFYLKNLPEKESLVVSYIGYSTDTVAINGRKRIDITMMPQANVINEVAIVSTGYQNLPKERATGSFGVVTAKELNKFPIVSVLERLQGLVPGVNISTKTTVGKSRNGTVNVRGISTIVSNYTRVNTDPLLVIDGFPSQQSITNGAFDFINPDDIEQVTFLKDAAAASIWGIQAANGVIVVTTKKGIKNSKQVINFSATMGTSQQPRADYGKLMSMPSYIALEQELIDKFRINDPVINTSTFFPENNSQAQAIIFAAKRGAITDAQRDQQLASLSLNDNSNQVSDLLLQAPTTRQYNISVSGGGPNSSNFVSGYFYSDDRAYKSNTNKGYSIKASNVSNLLNDRLTLTTDLTLGNTRDKINGAAVRAMSIGLGGLRPYDMLQDVNGNNIYYDVLATPQKARSLESKGYLPFKYSPVDELEFSNTYATGNNITINVAANGKITPWLSANLSGNMGRYYRERELYWERDSYEARMMVNSGTSINGNTKTLGVPQGGKLDLTNALGRTYSVRGQLLVDKDWNGKHHLNGVIGNEIREQFTKESGEIRYGVDKLVNAFRTVNPGGEFVDMYGNTQNIGATSRPVVEKTTRSLSYYANAAYSFDNRYTISASARFDDYNLLGVDRRNRAKPLWSTGLKWNLKNEKFMKTVTWLNQATLRATYGFSGNAPQGFAPVTVINLLGNEFYTGYPYGVIASPAVDNLGWETTRMINYGFDFGLFGNRVSASVEYYQKKTTDVIWNLPINGAYGFTSTLFNTAKLDGQGLDIGLTVVSLRKSDMTLSTTMNLSWNTNIVKDVRFEKPTLSFSPQDLYNGYPTDYLFSYVWAGLDNATGQSLIKDPKIPGKVYNVTEFPSVDIRTYSGRTTSPWFGSFSNSFQYKQWYLDVQLMYTFGGVFRKPSLASIGFSNNTNVGRSGDLDERWMKPGDEAFKNVPALYFGNNSSYNQSLARYNESDYLIRSRSNIRLQQISLSYNFSKKVVDKLGVKGLSVSGVCRNMGMIWAANKEKFDPDYLYTTGINYQLAPVPSFSFRAGLTF